MVMAASILRSTVKPKIGYVSLLSGYGGGVQGMMAAGLTPLLLNDKCSTNCKFLRERYGCPVVCGDATGNKVRKALSETKLKFGTIHVICAGFPCQDNSRLNKTKSKRKLDDPKGGAKRLWLGIKMIEVILDQQPWVAVIEQLANWQETKVFQLVIQKAERRGYTWRAFTINSCHYGVPQHRKRTYLILERKHLRVADQLAWRRKQKPSDIIKVLHQRRVRSTTQLRQWWPQHNLFWCYVSEDIFPEMPRLMGGHQTTPTVTTKTYGQQKPRYSQYRQRRRDAGNGSKAEYDSAHHFTPEDLLRLQGFPGKFRLPLAGWQCPDQYDPCLKLAKSPYIKHSAGSMIGNAMTTSVMCLLGS